MPLASDLRLDDGHSTFITFSGAPTIKLYEKSVTPPGISGTGPVDTTTMRNSVWRTQAPKKLKTLTPVSADVAYATSAIPAIHAQVNVAQRITITFPDGATLTFWGYLDEFAPGANVEGEQPTATVTIQPTNRDSSGNEAAPVYAAGPGTGTDTL
jgi:hypothetical protein